MEIKLTDFTFYETWSFIFSYPEKRLYGSCRFTAYPEQRAEGVCSASEVRKLSDVFRRMAFFDFKRKVLDQT